MCDLGGLNLAGIVTADHIYDTFVRGIHEEKTLPILNNGALTERVIYGDNDGDRDDDKLPDEQTYDRVRELAEQLVASGRLIASDFHGERIYTLSEASLEAEGGDGPALRDLAEPLYAKLRGDGA